MPRLFSGLSLPNDIRQQLSLLCAALPGAKWVNSENLHLSLRFVGDVDPHQAAEFSDALAALKCPQFTVRLQGLGIFGGKKPQTLWAGVAGNKTLADLARMHHNAARRAGLSPDGRKFTPHVTLARLRHTRPEIIAQYMIRNGAFESREFVIDEFIMFSARPRTGGGPYVIEETYPLALSGPDVAIEAETSRA